MQPAATGAARTGAWEMDLRTKDCTLSAEMATLLGMALGGWMSGAIFDLTGSYRAAFANGLGFNLLNGLIAFSLLRRRGSRQAYA